MKPIIKVKNLSKQYRIGTRRATYATLKETMAGAFRSPLKRTRGRNGDSSEERIWALKDVSFEVMPGEVVGVIGRNGAGKSTLLKILSRITEPTSGRVELYGRVGSLLEVGTGFHPELTGRENVYLSGSILGMSRREIERKFDEIIAFAEVERFIDTPVKHFSSGMYVRLAFAVAANLEPEILIIDEVLAVGDAAFQNKCLSKIRDLTKRGITSLFVTHNMHLVQIIAQQCLYFRGGAARYFNDPRQAIEMYLREVQISSDTDLAARLPEESVGSRNNNDCEIVSVKVLSASESTELNPGEDLVITMQYRFVSYPPSVYFNISIWSENGLLVTSADSRISDVQLNRGKGLSGFSPQLEGVVTCRFPSPPLVSGSYSVRGIILSDNDWPLASFGWSDTRFSHFTINPLAVNVSTNINWFMSQSDYGVVKVPFEWKA